MIKHLKNISLITTIILFASFKYSLAFPDFNQDSCKVLLIGNSNFFYNDFPYVIESLAINAAKTYILIIILLLAVVFLIIQKMILPYPKSKKRNGTMLFYWVQHIQLHILIILHKNRFTLHWNHCVE